MFLKEKNWILFDALQSNKMQRKFIAPNKKKKEEESCMPCITKHFVRLDKHEHSLYVLNKCQCRVQLFSISLFLFFRDGVTCIRVAISTLSIQFAFALNWWTFSVCSIEFVSYRFAALFVYHIRWLSFEDCSMQV